ncbi:MAG: CBS domain-containing protein [Gammaproteobacteria bacterium]|jgi:CBS domain-containing protein
MHDQMNLASLKVRDIEHLLVIEPAWVLETAAVEEVMEKMIADLRTRWVYVVDERKRLLGGVSMNAVVEILFPLEAIIERPDSLYEAYFPKISAKTAGELMLAPIPCVSDEITLAKLADLLLSNKMNEMPVVDSDNVLKGEVNVCEIIKACLGNVTTP